MSLTTQQRDYTCQSLERTSLGLCNSRHARNTPGPCTPRSTAALPALQQETTQAQSTKRRDARLRQILREACLPPRRLLLLPKRPLTRHSRQQVQQAHSRLQRLRATRPASKALLPSLRSKRRDQYQQRFLTSFRVVSQALAESRGWEAAGSMQTTFSVCAPLSLFFWIL